MENAVTGQRAALVCLPHAVTSGGRQLSFAAFLPRETLGAYIERTGVIVPRGSVVVWHNGRRVPDALWRRLIPRAGDQVVIRARVRGGGGGKLFRTVALLALTLTAPYIAGYAMTGTWAAATGFAGGVLTAGIVIGGTLMINALLPPPAATNIGSNDKYTSSPTYSIQGGRNRPRQWEPMILVFGRHKVVPDSAANPYTEYVGDDQYFRQAFHFGLQPDLNIGTLRIGSTPITDYNGVQVTRSDTESGALPSISGNVDTLQGFELRYADSWNSRTTPDDTEAIEVELAARLFAVDDGDGSFLTRSVLVQLEYRKVGAAAWIPLGNIKDAVYAKHYWSLGRMTTPGSGNSTGSPYWQQLSYGSAVPTEHTEGESVTRCSGTGGDEGYYCTTYTWRWIPHPHSFGRPWRGLAPDPLLGYTETDGYRLSNNSSDIIRRTITVEVERGQYELRVRKMTTDLDGNSESNQVSVSQIRAYQADDADYSGQLRLGVSIRASAQLNGPIDELSAVCSAQCWAWTGDAWELKENSNPAWWYLWYARGKRKQDGTRMYGAGMADSRIDIEAIKAWGAWCDLKKLTFDYVLDRSMSIEDVLQKIARAGRASPTWQTGKLGVIWDAADLPVMAIFGPFNIKAGSFKVDYINDGTADEIIVNFANIERDYDLDEVRIAVPGAAVSNNPLRLDLEGCVYADMAGREGNLLAASQVWHRRRVSWETDIEGFIASRGDVAQLSHDLTVWGYSGRLMPGSGGQVMVLDKLIPSGGSGTVMLRDPAGRLKVVSVVSELGEIDRLTITTPLDDEEDGEPFPMPGDVGYDDSPAMDWAWFFDPLATPGRRMKITGVTPTQDGVAFTAIDDDSEYYESENDPFRYTPPRDGALLGGVVLGVLFGESIRSIAADDIRVQIDWVLSVPGSVVVDVAINGTPNQTVTTTDRQLTVDAKTNDILGVTIRPAGIGGAGQPTTREYLVEGLLSPLPAVSGLTNIFRDGLTVLVWESGADVRPHGYEVRVGASWNDARTVAVLGSTREYLPTENGLHWVAARYAAGGTTIYGEPDSLLLSGAALQRNVMISQDEAPAWSGTLADGAVITNGELTLASLTDLLTEADVLAIPDVLLGAGVAESATYTIAAADRVDIGYVAPVRLDFLLEFYAVNLNQNILAEADILSIADVLGGSDAQSYRVRPQFRLAGEDGVFGPWRDPVPGVILGRHFDFRLVLQTTVPTIIPFVRHFTWVVDVPDLVQDGTAVTVVAAGMTVTYAKAYHANPNTHITVLDAQEGDRVVLTNQTLSGFDVQVLNGSAGVERKINWRSQGY